MNILFLGIDLVKCFSALPGLNGPANRFIRNALAEIAPDAGKYSCMSDWDRSVHRGILLLAAREFEKLGHKCKVISPQYVKPALSPGKKMMVMMLQAIAVALMQPTMQFVPPKSPEQPGYRSFTPGKAAYCQSPHCLVCVNKGVLDRGSPLAVCPETAVLFLLSLEDAENGLSSRYAQNNCRAL